MPEPPVSFSREPDRPGPVERRESLRHYPHDAETFRHLQGVVEGCPGTAQVRNLSGGGVSLLFGRRIEPEAVVNLQLLNTAKPFKCKVALRVIYLQERPSGQWILGGAFARKLEPSELEALLMEQP